MTIKSNIFTSGARSAEQNSFLNNGQIGVGMGSLPAGRGDAFEKLISTRICVRYTRSPPRVIGLFNISRLKPDLAHLGVTLAGSACRVKGVKIGRQAITQEWFG